MTDTTSVQALVSREGEGKGGGAFGFAAMMRSGAYTADDQEMVAAKFEALGNLIEQLRTDEPCQIIAGLIANTNQWERNNLNSVRHAIEWLNQNARPDLPLIASVRDMMDAANGN